MAETLIGGLTLTKATRSGGPEPFELLPHSRKLIANLLGWKRPDGRRLYRKAFASMGRKQAKTQTVAALVVAEFFLSQEKKQEIYMAAKDRDQASICFDAVADMIRASEDLLPLVTITESRKLIRHNESGSIIRALSSDGAGKHGYNPSLVVFDELHAWGIAEQELYDALTTGSKSRRNPLWVTITTAGSNQESICYREYQYAKRVASGEIQDESYFPLIYEVPIDADWTDQSLWPLALPTLGVLHDIRDYEEEFRQALARPEKQNTFRRLDQRHNDMDTAARLGPVHGRVSRLGRRAVLGRPGPCRGARPDRVCAVLAIRGQSLLPGLGLPAVENAGREDGNRRRAVCPVGAGRSHRDDARQHR